MIAVKKLKMVDSTKGHLEVYCDDVSELSSINLGEIEIEAGSIAYTSTGSLAIWDGNNWNNV